MRINISSEPPLVFGIVEPKLPAGWIFKPTWKMEKDAFAIGQCGDRQWYVRRVDDRWVPGPECTP